MNEDSINVGEVLAGPKMLEKKIVPGRLGNHGVGGGVLFIHRFSTLGFDISFHVGVHKCGIRRNGFLVMSVYDPQK